MDASVKVELRPTSESDLAFLSALYASTRTEELSQVPWSEPEKQSFLDQQFDSQHQFYQQQFPKATFDIILSNDKPIGRLYVDKRKDEIRLIDIALVAEIRGNGIGSALINNILKQARAEAKPVRIHVEVNNPAMRLYKRLGFKQIDNNGIYHLMEWKDDKNSSIK